MSKPRKSNSNRSRSLLVRPPTRRHPFETPDNIKIRSLSAIATSRKDVNMPQWVRRIKDNCQSTEIMHKVKMFKNQKKYGTRRKKLSVEENKYRTFLMKITDEIIKNRCFSVENIYMVFMKHIEENKNQLQILKMLDEMRFFCISVQVPFEESLSKLFLPLETTSSGDSEHIIKPTDVANISVDEKASLSRLTECTEPETEMESYRQTPSSISSFNSVNVLPGFENLETQTNNSTMVDVGTQKGNNFSKNVKYYTGQRPMIKVNLKNIKLKNDDFVMVECPVFLPKMVFDRNCLLYRKRKVKSPQTLNKPDCDDSKEVCTSDLNKKFVLNERIKSV